MARRLSGRAVWIAAASGGLVSAAVVEQACVSNYCTGSGDQQICFLYSPNTFNDAATDAGTRHDTAPQEDVVRSDAPDAFVPPEWQAGDGAPCTVDAGVFPSPVCDPSDETTCGPNTACTITANCGDPNTCEPFTTNPKPGTDGGVDNFRMREILLAAPASLANPIIQSSIVTSAVDLPASTTGSCGENGTGNFNWLLSVDKSKGTVTTGGAPASSDPFGTGYCYVNSTVMGADVTPITVPATFKGNTFSTTPYDKTLNIPIFIPANQGGGAVILPIEGASFYNVTMSADGNCIGSVNNASLTGTGTACVDQTPSGTGSCSRWHADGSLGGYITLAQANMVPVVNAGNEALCCLLAGTQNCSGSPPSCNATGLQNGNYCSNPPGPATATCHDSVWLAAEFAASAVIINDGKGNSTCGG